MIKQKEKKSNSYFPQKIVENVDDTLYNGDGEYSSILISRGIA